MGEMAFFTETPCFEVSMQGRWGGLQGLGLSLNDTPQGRVCLSGRMDIFIETPFLEVSLQGRWRCIVGSGFRA
jgi:hypothetical protein